MAMSNNCTTGLNPQFCPATGSNWAQNRSQYEDLLVTHSSVYPSADANIDLCMLPADKNGASADFDDASPSPADTYILTFDWAPAIMGPKMTLSSDDKEARREVRS